MDFKRLASATLSIVVALVLIIIIISNPKSAIASEKTDVVAVVHQFFDNLDEKNLQTALAVCDSPVSIVDEFPPHVWHGPTACADWWKGLSAYDEKSGITDGVATLGTPGPSTSPAIAPISWLQRFTPSSNMGNLLKRPTLFLR